MKKIKMVSAVVLSLLAASAYAQDVRYNFSSGTDFSKYKTYNWLPNKDTQIDQITDQQLRSSLDAELAKKHLTKSENNPDLLVGYQVALDQEKQTTMYNSSYGYGPGWGYYGGGGAGISTAETSTINVGVLDFDVYDAAQQKLIWRGTASKTLDAKAKPDKRQKNIDKGVVKLLKNFPPPLKKD